jgi:acyl-ACP thioesterase
VARYLQDVATDDSDDLGSLEARAWVVRRTLIEQHQAPRNSEDLSLATFCSGMGTRWAERRVSMVGAAGGSVEAVTLWVHLDPVTGRPKPLPAEFVATYTEPSGGREVTARQVHEPVVPGADDVHTMPWWPRVTDLDVLNHVNNAVSWEVVEQTLERVRARELIDLDPSGSLRAEVEFRDAIDHKVVIAAMPLTIAYRAVDGVLNIALWSTDGETVYMTAQVSSLS